MTGDEQNSTRSNLRADDPAPTEAASDAAPPPTLARRIATWTTNGFAIALVVMTGLAVGRQTINWWHDSRPVVESPSQIAGDQQLGDASRLHTFEFGSSPGAFAMRTFSGDESAALAELALLCRRVLAAEDHTWRPPSTAEAKLLQSTAKGKPVAAAPGEWEVHQLKGPLLLSVGIKHLKPAADAAPQRCIVCWAIAAPVLDAKGQPLEQYSLYVYSPAPPPAGSLSPLAELSWPAFLRPSLVIHSPGGDTVVGLTGDADLQDCAAFFDRELSSRQFLRQSPWSDTGKMQLSARFQHKNIGHVKVQLAKNAAGEIHGMAWFISRPEDSQAKRP